MDRLRPAGISGPPARLLLPLLCCALAARCTGAMALKPPSITGLRTPAEPPHPGKSVMVSCEAVSSLPELTLLYWLGNGSFVEKLHPDGAVSEGTVLEEPRCSGVVLRRDLHFSSFGAQHLYTNFTCVVLSPLGVDTREVRWPPPAPAPAPVESGGLG
ncbi:interleukin-18-binding protein isoform X2 [Aquila chrysaetos chrysaetos]|uniref:interleukin-18-binding protein isoform X2 n=1 Tax=Aquila chrysaetos chrysaetos TaxID=223781 RepID=UPI0005D06DA6|nr:interleukin-18-binding protein isoform X2 [Aquila chrysaetos chrysaetos]